MEMGEKANVSRKSTAETIGDPEGNTKTQSPKDHQTLNSKRQAHEQDRKLSVQKAVSLPLCGIATAIHDALVANQAYSSLFKADQGSE